MINHNVIITDLQTRKAFDIYNICNKLGYKIIGTYEGNNFEYFILNLIYAKKIQSLGNKSFFVDLKRLLEKLPDKTVFFPTEERTILNFYKYLENNQPDNLYYNLPSQSIFELVQDKGKFSAFCIKNNFPVPIEYKYDKLLSMNTLPCNLIIKPKIGSGSMGIRFIDSIDELQQCSNLDFGDYIIQERLDNSRNVEGAFFLFDKGTMISYYGHKRIRTFPENGGVTVYSKCELNTTLQNLGEKLLKNLNWSGLAMVEFLYDHKTQAYKIIEVNPRVWGSIMLSEFCGSNMIENYIKTSIGENVIKPHVNDKTYIRWVFPWDVLSYIRKKGNIKNFWDFSSNKTCYINFTYSSLCRSILFMVYNIIDPKKISKLFKKIFK